MKIKRRNVLALLVLAAACNDPATNDDRAYTKAPLENPGLVVEGEPATPMPELGEPDLLNDRPIADPAGGS